MAESLLIADQHASKSERYDLLLPQVKALIAGEDDLIANLANITAALHQSMQFFWTGFYFVKGNELVLGPFQGPVACTRIAFGKGVCGSAWSKKETIIVPDVDAFPGHIACSSLSKSEIVLPVIKDGNVVMILDVDSEHYSFFDETDAKYLGELMNYITELL